MTDLRFYCGLHQPGDAGTFERAFISINRLRGRRKPVACADVVTDSGAFVELEKWGRNWMSQERPRNRRVHVVTLPEGMRSKP
ncbi:hypothetical protein ASF33_20200 [Methylobacterium sp. Leaf92]|nr:hypothetical protein ASF33_20200 [Methylobacterium sp. Leaf92]